MVSSTRSNGKVLIVDDDDSIRKITGMQIKHLGFEVQVAENGVQAHKLLSETKFVLIFMDIHMPIMDGLEASRVLRKLERDEPRTSTPIIAITANPNKDRCLSAGINDFLFKPILLEDLRKIFTRWAPTQVAYDG